MADRVTVHVAGGTLTFTGPAGLLERPTDDEIRRRIAENAWTLDFHRHHAEDLHRLGHLETKLQLEFACLATRIDASLHTFCRERDVQVQSHPRPRGRRLR